MKNSEIRKLKVHTINRLNKFSKKQKELELLLLKQNNKKEFLTVKQLCEEFNISRKTFDRMRDKGLKVLQPKRNGKILVKRDDFINFGSQKSYL